MRQDCARIQWMTLCVPCLTQAEGSTVHSDSHIVQMMESRQASVLPEVTEVHSVNPGVCMSAGTGEILLGIGHERS